MAPQIAMNEGTPARSTTLLAAQGIIALALAVPTLEILVSNRNLQVPKHFATFTTTGGFAFMRAGILVALLLAVFAIWRSLTEERPLRGNRALWQAFILFFCTNIVISGVFGAEAELSRSHVYPAVLFAAMYYSVDDGYRPIVRAARNMLLIFMLFSLFFLFAKPELTQRIFADEVRLPFIDFRFWGLAESANDAAPLGLFLILFTMGLPSRLRWLNGLNYFCGGCTLLLAQSQTVWIIAAIILPWLALYRRGRFDNWQQLLRPQLIAPALVIGVLFAIGAALSISHGSRSPVIDVSAGEITLTGRTEVWSKAIGFFFASPIFGKGVEIWFPVADSNSPEAWMVHAHNQILQSLSTAGLVGGLGLMVYGALLIKYALAAGRATGGLAPALLFVTLIRCITEAPLDSGAAALSSVTMIHLILFRLALTPSGATTASAH